MAERWEDIPRNRKITDRLKSLVNARMTYQRAKARLLREDPSIRSATLTRAEQQARQERLVEGRQRADATRRKNAAIARATEALEPQQQLPPEQREVINYNATSQQTQGEPYRRVDVTYRDPHLDRQREVTVYLPLTGQMSEAHRMAMIYAAIMLNDRRDISESDDELYGALLRATQINQVF